MLLFYSESYSLILANLLGITFTFNFLFKLTLNEPIKAKFFQISSVSKFPGVNGKWRWVGQETDWQLE
jgi:hypothetical protein